MLRLVGATSSILLPIIVNQIDRLVSSEKNPVTRNDGEYLKTFVEINFRNLLQSFLYDGFNGMFAILRADAASTPTPLDDVKIAAIENATRYALEKLFEYLD